MSTSERETTEPAHEPHAGTGSLRCDTCGRLSSIVSRVVIDRGYDRSNARPLWNCPECYAKKEQLRKREAGESR